MTDHIISPDGKFMWTGSEWILAPPTPTTQSANVSMQDSVVGRDVNITNTTNITQSNAEDIATEDSQDEVEVKLEDWRFAVIAFDKAGWPDKRTELIEEVRSPTKEELFELISEWAEKITMMKSYVIQEVKMLIIPPRELLFADVVSDLGKGGIEMNASAGHPSKVSVEEYWEWKAIDQVAGMGRVLLPRLSFVFFPIDETINGNQNGLFTCEAHLWHYISADGSVVFGSTSPTLTINDIITMTTWLIEENETAFLTYDWDEEH